MLLIEFTPGTYMVPSAITVITISKLLQSIYTSGSYAQSICINILQHEVFEHIP